MTKLRSIGAVFAANIHGKHQTYHYYVPEGHEPKVGDLVLTSVSWSPDTCDESDTGTLSRKLVDDARLARIVEVSDEPHAKATKFYLMLLPREDLLKNGEANKALLEKAKAKSEARAKLEKMLREQAAIDLYRKLAETNSEAAELLKILDS